MNILNRPILLLFTVQSLFVWFRKYQQNEQLSLILIELTEHKKRPEICY